MQTCNSIHCGYQFRPELSHNWGVYSPWFSAKSEIPSTIPDGCNITFAQVLMRHGSRYPTEHKTIAYRNLIQKIHEKVQRYGPQYSFIKSYQFNLGADQLTRYGQQELFNAGIQFFERYSQLSRHSTPFVRASDRDRVVDSACHWIQGFQDSKQSGKSPEASPCSSILKISEEEGFNNTLDHGLCRDFEEGPYDSIAKDAADKWAAVFVPPIRHRANTNLPGANLTIDEVIYLMDMCPFNTVASSEGKMSPFCDLFDTTEWQHFGYSKSLAKYYRYGDGNPLGPTQGVGYVNELIARLTGKPVWDHTSTNRTLDENQATFPLDRHLYADFSHDSALVSIFSALGLYDATEPLSNTTYEDIEQTHGFSTSIVVPFASRAYFEKMQCADHPGEEMIRILVNDRVMPLPGCDKDPLGRCLLRTFINSLSFAKQGGLWDDCFK